MFFAAQTHEQKNDNENFGIAVVFFASADLAGDSQGGDTIAFLEYRLSYSGGRLTSEYGSL